MDLVNDGLNTQEIPQRILIQSTSTQTIRKRSYSKYYPFRLNTVTPRDGKFYETLR